MVKRAILFVSVLILLGASSAVFGDNKPGTAKAEVVSSALGVPEFQLRVSRVHPVKGLTGLGIGQVSFTGIGQDGTLYSEFVDHAEPGRNLLYGISPDGTKVTQFDFSGLAGLAKVEAEVYCAGPNGGVYALVHPVSGAYELVEFASDGKVSKRITVQLPRAVDFTQLAALPHGTFFASGKEHTAAGNAAIARPFRGIFDGNGGLIREVALPGEQAGALSTVSPELQESVDLSAAIPAADGNLYLLKLTRPATVFVVSGAGKVIRQYQLAQPFADATPFRGFAVAGDRLAVFFSPWNGEDAHIRLRTVSVGSGKPLADYALDPELGFQFVDVREGSFRFLRFAKGQIPTIVDADQPE